MSATNQPVYEPFTATPADELRGLTIVGRDHQMARPLSGERVTAMTQPDVSRPDVRHVVFYGRPTGHELQVRLVTLLANTFTDDGDNVTILSWSVDSQTVTRIPDPLTDNVSRKGTVDCMIQLGVRPWFHFEPGTGPSAEIIT